MKKTTQQLKTEDRQPSLTLSITLLSLVIILIIAVIFVNIFSNIEREFISFDFQINSTSNGQIDWFNQEIAQTTLTNTNSILPVRIEVEQVYICIINSQNQELVFSLRLNPQTQFNTEYGLFNNIQYIDIPAGQTKTIQYMLNLYRFGNEELIRLEEQNLLEIEFRSTQEHNWRGDFAREVCLGNQRYSVLE